MKRIQKPSRSWLPSPVRALLANCAIYGCVWLGILVFMFRSELNEVLNVCLSSTKNAEQMYKGIGPFSDALSTRQNNDKLYLAQLESKRIKK